MVRRKALLPSGVHDNAVIQSTSHLLPFSLVEETIMGSDGSLSTDGAHSHFLDGCVWGWCVERVLYWEKVGFVTWEPNEILTLCWQPVSREVLLNLTVEQCLPLFLYTHTFSWTESILLFNHNTPKHITGHNIISTYFTFQHSALTDRLTTAVLPCSEQADGFCKWNKNKVFMSFFTHRCAYKHTLLHWLTPGLLTTLKTWFCDPVFLIVIAAHTVRKKGPYCSISFFPPKTCLPVCFLTVLVCSRH